MDGDETGRKKFNPRFPPDAFVHACPPTAPWRRGTVTQPSGPDLGHGCDHLSDQSLYIYIYIYTLPYLIYLSRNPPDIRFCRLFLVTYGLAKSNFRRNTRARYHATLRSARACFCPLSLSLSFRRKEKKKQKLVDHRRGSRRSEGGGKGHSSRLFYARLRR